MRVLTRNDDDKVRGTSQMCDRCDKREANGCKDHVGVTHERGVIMNIQQEYKEALLAVDVARNHFNYADADFFDAANKKLTAAKAWCDAVYLRLKKEEKGC